MLGNSNLDFQNFWSFPPTKRPRILISRGSKHVRVYLKEFVFPNSFLKRLVIYIAPFYYNTVQYVPFSGIKGTKSSTEKESIDFTIERAIVSLMEKIKYMTSKDFEIGIYLGSEGKFNKKTLRNINFRKV